MINYHNNIRGNGCEQNTVRRKKIINEYMNDFFFKYICLKNTSRINFFFLQYSGKLGDRRNFEKLCIQRAYTTILYRRVY